MTKKKPNWVITHECKELQIKIEGEMYSEDMERLIARAQRKPEKVIITNSNRGILVAIVEAFVAGELKLGRKQSFTELARFVGRTFLIEKMDRKEEYVSESSILSTLYKIRRDL